MFSDIKEILETAVHAPSGSNSQPWEFKVKDNRIDVIALPKKDHPVLNFRNRGTWVAHGALIENLAIAAREFGYHSDIILFPDQLNHHITARVYLQKLSSERDLLYKAIRSRTTNRKLYMTSPLAENKRRTLQCVANEHKISGVEAKFIEDSEQIKRLAVAASVNEIVMFENRALHKLLFEEIVWTKKEEEQRGRGLLFRTMELKPPALVVKALSFWPLMRILNFFGVARAIAKDNVKMYSATSLMCAIMCGNTDEDFVNAGRLMERIWLQATSIGLGCHLMTGVLFLWQRIAAGETKLFSDEHIKLVEDAYQKTSSICEAENRNVALLFRIGRGDPPSARSLKLPPVVSYN